jgi:kynurenine formamidase
MPIAQSTRLRAVGAHHRRAGGSSRGPIASGRLRCSVASVTDEASDPPFDSLPLLPTRKWQHSWEVWGPGDNLGTLNRLTDSTVAAAAGCVRTGERIGVSLPMELPSPAFFGRKPFEHHYKPMGDTAWDDWVDGFYFQCASQWDGLRHVGTPDGWYGGWRGDPAADPEPLGIHHWARQGIIGRGVLVDLAAFASRDSGDGPDGYDPFTRVAFTPDDLRAALDAQGVELRRGDILCVRTGWVDKYLGLDEAARTALAATMQGLGGWDSAGLDGSEEIAGFLWDSGIAAVACDNPSVEVVPVDPEVGSLHGRLIACLGMAIGELFSFSDLAAACAREGRYEFLFTAVPLNVAGAVGSPGNAVAIL